jgi:lysozyme
MSKAKLAAIGLTAAVGLVAGFEGLKQYAYRDAVGIPTICYGHTGPDVKFGSLKSREECANLLESDLMVAYDGLRYCTNVRLTDGERIAYTSFVFNVGAQKYCRSTINRKLHSGDRIGACYELRKWVYAGNQRLPGLVKRRESELSYCLRDLQ